MKKIVQRITQSVEWVILTEMSKPKIILMALALNVAGYFIMYKLLDLFLIFKYGY
jgi:DNA-binding NarL/FixJ family response regulator